MNGQLLYYTKHTKLYQTLQLVYQYCESKSQYDSIAKPLLTTDGKVPPQNELPSVEVLERLTSQQTYIDTKFSEVMKSVYNQQRLVERKQRLLNELDFVNKFLIG